MLDSVKLTHLTNNCATERIARGLTLLLPLPVVDGHLIHQQLCGLTSVHAIQCIECSHQFASTMLWAQHDCRCQGDRPTGVPVHCSIVGATYWVTWYLSRSVSAA